MKLKLVYNLITFLLTILIFSSCKNLSSDTQQLGTDKITGKVSIEGVIVAEANINIDDVANWQTKTDANGNFKISTISDGEHILYIKKDLSSGESIYFQTTINLTQSETDLGSIDFPKPVKINNSNLTVAAIPLSWEKSTSALFKGYKVYRQEGLAVDNVNGELVFSTTAVLDTSFIDYKFVNGTQYSYRVYITTEDGKLGGSNTISINSVSEVNFISNGRFEISSDGISPDFWQSYSDGTPSYKIFTIDGSEYNDGKTSLKINFIDSLIVPNNKGSKYSSIYQRIFSNDFIAGNNYQLSFWVKSNVGQARVRLYRVSTIDTLKIAEYFGPSEYGWNQQKLNFTMPSSTNYLQVVIDTQFAFSINGITQLWFDGIKLSPL